MGKRNKSRTARGAVVESGELPGRSVAAEKMQDLKVGGEVLTQSRRGDAASESAAVGESATAGQSTDPNWVAWRPTKHPVALAIVVALIAAWIVFLVSNT